MIVIINYGMGNLHSVLNAFKRVGASAKISSKKEDIKKAEKLVLPGVGFFREGIKNLKKLELVELLNKRVIESNVPILGICLGMQMMTKFSEEGNCGGLGWFDANTIKFRFNEKFRIPHMGWNDIKTKKRNSIFDGINVDDLFYFVHSFHVMADKEDILSVSNYGVEFVSAIQKENLFGLQFHPEKSHGAGLRIIKNFAEKV